MVKRHCSLPFKFYCITENTTDIDSNIICLPLPTIPVKGWWFKPYIFSNSLSIKGTVLYLDLDLVIVDNIDKLFQYLPKKLCIIRDFVRAQAPAYNRFNSSVIKFSAGKYNYIWEDFARDPYAVTTRYRGDQDYLYRMASKTAIYFPDNWIKSYKWEIRQSPKVDITRQQNERKFKAIEQKIVTPKECCIAAFHGDPRPHNCEDPYIMNHWK
jgi:hypothetical protein